VFVNDRAPALSGFRGCLAGLIAALPEKRCYSQTPTKEIRNPNKEVGDMIRANAFRSLAAGVLAAVAFMAVSPSVQAGSDDERVVGAIVGSVIGGAIGSTIGRGAERGVAIGVGSLLGGIVGYHAVDPDPYRHHRRGHRHLRHRRHVHYDYPLAWPPVHVYPRHPRRERHVHHHYYESQPRPVVTYQLPAPVPPAAPVRQVNVVTAPPRGRSGRSLETTLTECRVLEAGIAPVYACRTAGGDWRILK
jgi:hypothetical protein